MAITISHASALHATRLLRSAGAHLASMDRGSIATPQPWMGTRWTKRNFTPESWNWHTPSAQSKLHILVKDTAQRVRMSTIRSHTCKAALPPGSIIWLDENTTMPCPELLFVQMAETASLPALVLLGHELCGNFSRFADNPIAGPVTDMLPAATSVDKLRHYLDTLKQVPGIMKAREAVNHIADHAVSVPEAILATMYALPPSESGYGMGPITLNRQIDVTHDLAANIISTRFPDILFPFAPVGINYDGEGHLDPAGLAKAARTAERADAQEKLQAEQALVAKIAEVREKAIDDIRRTRELAASGFIVFPATKEDLFEWGQLDEFTRQILDCAQVVFGADVATYRERLDDTESKRDRFALLSAMLPSANPEHSEVV